MINGIKPMLSKSTPTPKEPTTNGLSFDKAMDNLLDKIQESYDGFGVNDKKTKRTLRNLKKLAKLPKFRYVDSSLKSLKTLDWS